MLELFQSRRPRSASFTLRVRARRERSARSDTSGRTGPSFANIGSGWLCRSDSGLGRRLRCRLLPSPLSSCVRALQTVQTQLDSGLGIFLYFSISKATNIFLISKATNTFLISKARQPIISKFPRQAIKNLSLLCMICRGLCKKGDQCEFLHEFDMTKMPECYFYTRFNACHNKVRHYNEFN
jgi:hypothetical protein